MACDSFIQHHSTPCSCLQAADRSMRQTSRLTHFFRDHSGPYNYTFCCNVSLTYSIVKQHMCNTPAWSAEAFCKEYLVSFLERVLQRTHCLAGMTVILLQATQQVSASMCFHNMLSIQLNFNQCSAGLEYTPLIYSTSPNMLANELLT